MNEHFRPKIQIEIIGGTWLGPFDKKSSYPHPAHVIGLEIDAEPAADDEFDIPPEGRRIKPVLSPALRGIEGVGVDLKSL